MKAKERQAIIKALGELPQDAPHILLASAQLVGEGFDHAPLDTLILTLPISWTGTLQQYAGRLHRRHEAKGAAVIFDYLDENHAITNAMFRRRLAGYRELNYSVEMAPGSTTAWFENG